MKIKGRLIATLAALGLLIAMLPIGPAAAAVGTVVLKGGAGGGAFFSDKDVANIVTIEVTDEDITPARPGLARQLLTENKVGGEVERTFPLSEMILGGEKTRSDRFEGGNKTVTSTTTTDGISADAVVTNPDEGDAIVVETVTVDADGETETATVWHFNLSRVVRDQHSNTQKGVGTVDADDVEVVVDGRVQEFPDDFAINKIVNLSQDCPGDGADPVVVTCAGGGFNRITLNDDPSDGFENVVINYEYSEYEFDNDTPIRLQGTSFFHGAGDNYTAADTQVNIDTAGPGSITPATDINGGTAEEYILINFAYHVKDFKKELVTLASATAGERMLDLTETLPASNVFQTSLALFNQGDYQAIASEAGNADNDSGTAEGGDIVISIGEMLAGLDRMVTTGTAPDTITSRVYPLELKTRVTTAISSSRLNLDTGHKASDLVDRLLQVAHGDTLTFAYTDASPGATIVKTATIDLEAPVVTLIGPVDRLFSNSSAHQLNVDVVDDGAGVESDNIMLVASGMSLGSDTAKAPIVNGFRVTNVPSILTEGEKKWFVTVRDKVGNTPAKNDLTTKDINEAPRGAAPPMTATPDNPFAFTVDTSAPVISGGRTGMYLMNAGVTTGDVGGQEDESSNNREWVRVQFNLGAGGAPLDASTISVGDFRVAGAEPLAAIVNANPQGDIDKGGAVYLQVPEQETDAKPKVDVVGEISDRAGNIRTESTISAVNDGLAPVITVTTEAKIVKDEMTITVTSSERLGINPVVRTTDTKPVEDVALAGSIKVLAISLKEGTFTTYTSTFPKGAGASKQYVVVEATDQSNNKETVGDGTTTSDGETTDLVSFQVDDRAPKVEFVDPNGKVLEDTKQEEGAVWLVAQFDEYEHSGDGYWKVTVSDVTLRVKDGDPVTTDTGMLFGQDAAVECTAHAGAAATDKCVDITLAVVLTPGIYTYSITGVDTVGNEVSKNVDFEVIEAEPFELKLKPGVNLVSIPGMPRGDGGMLDIMLADAPVSTVLTYDGMAAASGDNPWLSSVKDPETDVFSGDITMIEPGKAYFITSSASYTVKVKLEAVGSSLPPTIMVRQGYNAIGFVSISDTESSVDIEQYLSSIGWSVAYSYDPTPGQGWKTFRKGQSTEDDTLYVEPGKGYLVYAQYDATLTP